MNLYALGYSRLALGTMRLGVWGANYPTPKLSSLLQQCLELNISTLDLADIYGDYSTESDWGKVFKAQSSLRTQVQIVTKCGIKRVCAARPQHRIKSYDLSKAHIVASVEQSLLNLHTNYIDLLLLHRPDFLMHPDEVAEAFTQLQKAGKVRHFGVSNFSTTQFSLLDSRFKLLSNQVEVSLMARAAFNNGILDQCLQKGIKPMAWSPLGGGALFSADNAAAQRVQAAAIPICAKYEATLDQIAYAWLLRHPAEIMPVLGTTKIARIRAAVQAQQIELNRSEWYTLWQAATGKTIA